MNHIDFRPILITLFFLILINSIKGQEKIEHTQITTIDNKKIEIVDNRNILVFYLWETNSRVSHNEIKYLNNLVNKYKNENIIFIAATNDKRKKLETILNKTSFLFNHVYGKEGKKIMKLFNNNGIIRFYPRYFIVDSKGNIITSAIGSCTTIHSLLETELNKKP